MTPRCACGQPAPNAQICTACERDLTAALVAVTVLTPELDTTLAGAAGVGTGHILATVYAHTTPLPYDERASEGMRQLRVVLSGWVRVLVETLGGGWPADTLPAMARYLVEHMADVRRHEAAGDIHREIIAAVRRAWVVIDNPAPRVYAGPCDCGTHLYGHPGRQLVSCPACGTTWGIAERQDWMRSRLADQLVTAHEASLMLGGIGIHVSDGTIRMWHHRHRLEPHFPAGVAHPRYRLGAIADLCVARDTRAGLGVSCLRSGPLLRHDSVDSQEVGVTVP